MSVAKPLFARAAESGVNAENPWPGLAPFTEDLSRYFFGRDEEINHLFRLLQRETLTVLFGQSGLGKSSLLQAGLFPKLREADFVPVYVRLDHDEKAPPLAAQVRAALHSALQASGVEAPPFPEDETLWEYFHRKDVDFWSAQNRLTTPVLVLDQFEELFTLGRGNEARRARGEAFLDELADLIEDRPPAALKRKLESGGADAGRFYFNREFCKVLLSLREDYLPDLESLRPRLPSVMHNRLRIARLRADAAWQAVAKPGAALLEAGVAEQIVQFVAGAEDRASAKDTQREVDPALLNVVCRELNNRRLQAGQPKITADLLAGNRREILAEFYERSLRDLPAAVRVFVEDRLITKSGYRDNVALDNALGELAGKGVTREAIDRLVNRRLLRLEERLGVPRMELTHDVLTGVIRASRDARQEKETRAALEETRRRAALERRRARQIVAVVSLALLLAVVSGVYAGWLWLQARAQAKQADARRIADNAETVLRMPEKPAELGLLLAIESLKKSPTLEGDSALRAGLALLPGLAGPTIPEGHVTAMTFSSNGQFIVVADRGRSVRVWETATARDVATLPLAGPAHVIAISPDGTILAAGNAVQTRLWRDWLTARPTNFATLPGPAQALAFSSNGNYLAVGGTNASQPVRVFSVTNAAYVLSLSPGETRQHSTTALLFSPDGQHLVASGYRFAFNRAGKFVALRETIATVWAWLTGQEGHDLPDTLRAGARLWCSEDGKALWMIGSGAAQRYEQWRSPRATVATSRNLPPALDGLRQVTPYGRYLATSAGGLTRVWQWTNWEDRDPVEVARLSATGLTALSPDGALLAIADAEQVRVWALADRPEAPRLKELYGSGAFFFRFSDDSRFLAAADYNGLHVLDVVNRREFSLPTEARTLAFSPDGGSLAAVSDSGVDLWHAWQTGQTNQKVRLLYSDVQAVSFSPDGKYLATMRGAEVELWENWRTSQPLKVSRNWPPRPRLKLPGGEDLDDSAPAVIAFSADGRHLSAAIGGVARSWVDWNMPAPRQVAEENIKAQAIAFTADGATFVAAKDGVVRVSHLLGGRQVAEIIYDEKVHDVALSPDGKFLAIGSDGTAQLWDVARRERVLRIPCAGGSTLMVNGVVFSPDGRYVATLTDGETVQVWHRHAEDLIAAARGRLSRNLTLREWKQYFGEEPYRKTIPDLPMNSP
jgi:WD40 repeat protein